MLFSFVVLLGFMGMGDAIALCPPGNLVWGYTLPMCFARNCLIIHFRRTAITSCCIAVEKRSLVFLKVIYQTPVSAFGGQVIWKELTLKTTKNPG